MGVMWRSFWWQLEQESLPDMGNHGLKSWSGRSVGQRFRKLTAGAERDTMLRRLAVSWSAPVAQLYPTLASSRAVRWSSALAGFSDKGHQIVAGASFRDV